MIKCSVCNNHPATVKVIPVRLDETDEYEQWLTIDCLEDETTFVSLQSRIDAMREELNIIRNRKDWGGNFRIFTKETIHPCPRCQKEQDAYYHAKVIIPQRLVEAGVKREYLSANLDDCGKWAEKYIGKSLFLYGASGTGKTHTIIALLRHDVANNKAVAFITVFDLLHKIKASFSQTDGQTEQRLITYYSNVQNLYLDDVGVERLTEWSLPILYSIIDSRYSNQRRTIITSNMDTPDLHEIVGDRIVSRIIGLCGQPIKLNGKDRRLPDK